MENPLDFSKRSRRAILIFTGVMLVLVLIPRVYFLLHPADDFEFHQTELQKEAFENFEYKKKEKTGYNKKNRFSRPKSKFDPNQYSEEQWMTLGLSKKQVAVLMKYKSSGFYAPEDLKKVFVISDEFFNIIKDSLIYPQKPTREYRNETVLISNEIRKVELNSASLEELMDVKGIGKFYAEKIIQKRNELQGFVNENQLLEIWKFDSEKLETISPYITVNSMLVQPFDINTVSVNELKKHPYFSYNIANSIVKLRTQLGSYKRIEDLKKSVLISDELYEKIKPYVMVEN